MPADSQSMAAEAATDEDLLLALDGQGKAAVTIGRKRWAVAAASSALLALGCAAAWAARGAVGPSSQSQALGEVVVEADAEACSKDYVGDCRHKARCCDPAMTCFTQSVHHSECRYVCKKDAYQPGRNPVGSPWECDTPLGNTTTWKFSHDKPSLYCYLFMSLFNEEPALVKTQLATQSGIFSCNMFTVFAESTSVVGPGPKGPIVTHATGVIPQSWDRHKKIRTNFIHVWKAIRGMNHYQWHDYTIKIDPDTVFFASRLRWRLKQLGKDPHTSAFRVANCQTWDSTQGVIEILSKAAASKFLWHVDHCAMNPGNLARGEDWFTQQCWDQMGVQKVRMYSAMHDRYCAHTQPTCHEHVAAYHPLKTPHSYKQCVLAAGGHTMIM